MTADTFYPAGAMKSVELTAQHPRVSGPFLMDKKLWNGKRVAVIVIWRGDHRHKTTRRIYYGTLDLSAGEADQFGIRSSGGELSVIHRNRAVDVFDMTRKK